MKGVDKRAKYKRGKSGILRCPSLLIASRFSQVLSDTKTWCSLNLVGTMSCLYHLYILICVNKLRLFYVSFDWHFK
jgi:hypothetical protein